MNTCQIKWIDDSGNPTPDDNPAIARVRTIARVEQIGGRGVKFEASDWFCICEEHAKRLNDRGMHIWECEALPAEMASIWNRPAGSSMAMISNAATPRAPRARPGSAASVS